MPVETRSLIFNQLPLKLSQGANDVHHEAARRGAEVDKKFRFETETPIHHEGNMGATFL